MGRWTGSWLSGPEAAGVRTGPGQRWRGERLGLPESGPASLAPPGRRVAAFLLDALLSTLVARAINPHPRTTLDTLLSTAVLAVDYVLFPVLSGQTIGMRLVSLRLVRVDARAPVGPLRAAVRFVLLALLVPALIWDADGRGMHDRASGTAVVRA